MRRDSNEDGLLCVIIRDRSAAGYARHHAKKPRRVRYADAGVILLAMSETKRITEEDVRHVARLSRLHLEEHEVTLYTQQLGSVLDYIAKIGELDVSDVQPMAHALDLTNVLREDVEQPGLPVAEALENAPQRSAFDDMHFFKVPKVLGEGSGA